MKKLIVIGSIALIAGMITLSFKSEPAKKDNTYTTLPKDSVGSAKAFMKVYSVLMSSRCVNCHPSDDASLQGDDHHIHTMNTQRELMAKVSIPNGMSPA